mmetsp:Transcript_69310/g.129453  ORF Transcript_69310/g.129453 Transcript_69310/m.129453 type:complete len:492 (+) Transcript_69310:68-1543(+)
MRHSFEQETMRSVSVSCGGGAASQQPSQVLLSRGSRTWQEDDEDRSRFASAQQAKNLGLSSPFAGSVVLANTLLGGSGMLGIPRAFSTAGYLLGSLLIVVSGYFSAQGSHLLQCSAVRLGQVPSSFEVCSREVLPWWARWIVDAAVAIKCFGVACSYLIITGDLIPPALTFFGVNIEETLLRRLVITLAFCIAGPLACLPRLTALRYTSMVTVMIVVWTSLLIFLFYAGICEPCATPPHSDEHSMDSPFVSNVSLASIRMLAVNDNEFPAGTRPCNGAPFDEIGSDFTSMLKALPVFVFGFTCQQNVFTVCNEVRGLTRRRMNGIIFAAYMVAGAAFYFAALLSYRTFGDALDSDVLKSYPDESALAQATRILFACVAVFSYPLQIHPSRVSCIALLRMLLGDHLASTNCTYWIFTIILLAGSYWVAFYLDNLGKILGIVGATGSTAVTFILPGLIYLNVYPTWHAKRVAAAIQLLLGCVIMPTCLTVLFM